MGLQRREFFLGAAGTLAVFGAFLAFRWVTHEEPPPPAEWLTEAEQEELADALTSFDTWAAGCLWEARDRQDIGELIREPDGKETLWRGEARSGRAMSFLTVDGVTALEDMQELSGPGYFCYAPE